MVLKSLSLYLLFTCTLTETSAAFSACLITRLSTEAENTGWPALGAKNAKVKGQSAYQPAVNTHVSDKPF